MAFNFDPNNVAETIKHHRGETWTAYNGDGEKQILAVRSERVDVITFQSNHWIRENSYWNDGTVDECFEGRW